MEQAHEILIVDDDRAMREMLSSLFSARGFQVAEAASGDQALETIADSDVEVVLSDIRMPGRSGIDLVGELRRLRPQTPVVLMTAFGTIGSAVEAMRVGAFDYITKPFEPDAVALAVDRALEWRSLEEENRRLRKAVDRTGSLGDLIGESAAMREIFAVIKRVAQSKSSVLVSGESGTGKDLVARAIHYHGVRAAQPFVPINCTAIPEGLLESELFGHVRGAFTGAHASRQGLFEKADGGTLFLDEVGDMGMGLQSKLLRVLQDQEIRPVGGTKTTKVDVRIVAATNQDLEQAIADGRFREDLFYRLNVIPLRIPPLRERPDDIPPLVEAFLRKHATDGKRWFSKEALDRLSAYAWRGNARELENVVERALALTDSTCILPEELPLAAGEGEPEEVTSERYLRNAALRGVPLSEIEHRYVTEVLDVTGGNKVKAARILGIDRKTLYRRAERRAARQQSAS